MRAKAITLAAATAMVCTIIGCGGSPKSVSDSKYLLGLLHESWTNARAGIDKNPPDLGPLRGINNMLARRVPRRIEKDYAGSNKAEVLAKITALRDAYTKRISSKLDLRSNVARLRRGAKLQDVRTAFWELDKQYKELEEMLE